MAGNEEVVSFNSAHIETNTRLMDVGITAETSTPEANAKRIASNKERMENIIARNKKYNDDAAAKDDTISKNRANIEKNAADIAERRKLIKANRADVMANGEKAAEKLMSSSSAGDVVSAVKALADGDKANHPVELRPPQTRGRKQF